MLPSAAELIAHYLRTNGFTETLTSFVKEAGLPSDVGITADEKVTIETILQEKKTFDLSLNFEKLGTNDADREWTERAPVTPNTISTLPNRSNILSVNVLHLSLSATEVRPYIAVTTADRQLHLVDPSTPNFDLVHSYSSLQDSPTLDVVSIGSRYLLVASMSGKLTLFDLSRGSIVDQRHDHTKYLVKLAVHSNGSSVMVASAGWDSKVFFYNIDITVDNPRLTLLTSLVLPSIPETIVFIEALDSDHLILLVARRDSTFLHYYSVDASDESGVTLLGQQNLAPHSNAWVAFTPADVQVCPKDPHLVAVATSSTPHMRLLVVKLLLPLSSQRPSSGHVGLISDDVLEPSTQASQARAELAIANREERAILVNTNTLAPQTPYSTPRIVWRPDASGVYVSSDDGVIRGIEAKSGKLVASLKAHEPGSKIRCLWAGHITTDNVDAESSEYLVSGGFDQKLILWRVSA
ncbi:hypothetical protein IAQ61_009692 [Plenodomus lingam]|uniref:Uncharacterized protein n=1 Tax=Leptosphaeria maculans (strain JN3 / isolate v23.1.3 / race Av1-4-5-6-7-8) TaxID=985895 RepID=E4ZT30_LEPMJ|nr:hypothetical protein LEMA_P119520.1 [Plenodomus lingam JN3]KAH9863414.1 hypothetical protein IAQ61_009692 [Plenodomus lingam]CBX94461.1 hypothetical protein LEMA_P119520.1 [Plenodomus lingam JN3]